MKMTVDEIKAYLSALFATFLKGKTINRAIVEGSPDGVQTRIFLSTINKIAFEVNHYHCSWVEEVNRRVGSRGSEMYYLMEQADEQSEERVGWNDVLLEDLIESWSENKAEEFMEDAFYKSKADFLIYWDALFSTLKSKTKEGTFASKIEGCPYCNNVTAVWRALAED